MTKGVMPASMHYENRFGEITDQFPRNENSNNANQNAQITKLCFVLLAQDFLWTLAIMSGAKQRSAAMNIISNRVYQSDLRTPVELFCHGAGIDSFRWIEADEGFRIEAATADYRFVIQAIDVIDATSVASERARRRYDLAEKRRHKAEHDKLNAIKRRRRAAQTKAAVAVQSPRLSSRRKQPARQ